MRAEVRKKEGWSFALTFLIWHLSLSTLPLPLIFLMTNTYFLHSPPSMLRREGRPWKNNFPILNGIIILSSTINQQKHNYSCKEEHYKCSVLYHCALFGYLTILTKNKKFMLRYMLRLWLLMFIKLEAEKCKFIRRNFLIYVNIKLQVY